MGKTKGGGAPKVPATKKVPKTKVKKEEEKDKGKKSRAPRFSTQETDHLLILMEKNNLHTQITNQMTPQMRSKAWLDVSRAFNVAPFVVVSIPFSVFLWFFF